MSEKIRAKIATNLKKVAMDMEALEKDLDVKVIDPLYQRLSMDMDYEEDEDGFDEYNPDFYEDEEEIEIESSTDYKDVKEEPMKEHDLEVLEGGSEIKPYLTNGPEGGSEIAPYINSYVRMSAYLDKCADHVESELNDTKLAKEIDEVADIIDQKISKLKKLSEKGTSKEASKDEKTHLNNMKSDIEKFLKGDFAKSLSKSNPDYIKSKKDELVKIKKMIKGL